MRKLCLVLLGLMVAMLFGTTAKADDVHYTLTGVFGPATGGAPFSGANGSFTMSFNLPQMPTPDYLDADVGDFAIFSVPVSYSFLCDGCSTPVSFGGPLDDVVFGTTATGGMMAVEFSTVDDLDY
jgi:hypothetical protein